MSLSDDRILFSILYKAKIYYTMKINVVAIFFVIFSIGLITGV